MATASKSVGNYGTITVEAVSIPNSQNTANNTSVIRVTGRIRNRGTAASHNSSVGWSFGSGVSKSGNFAMIVGAGSTQTVNSSNFTIAHASNGTKTVTVSFTLGNSGTFIFGSGGTVSVRLVLPRIPQVPSKPSRPTVSGISSSSWTARIGSAPANNGASISRYEWQVQNVDSSNYGTNNTTGRSWTRTGQLSNTRYRVRVRARNSAGVGSYSSWSSTFTTKPGLPTAPGVPTVTRVSDGRQDVAWSRNATVRAPYASQRVQRNHWLGEARSPWVSIATVSGSVSSFADTTTQKHNDYRYRVQAVNASGTGTSAQSDRVRTTPAPPTNVSARKSSGGITVSFTQVMTPDSGNHNEVQDNPGGTGWVTVGAAVNQSPFTHNSPNPSLTHQYRVRTVDTLNGTLNGEWSTLSNVVQLLTAPLAPSLVGPVGVADRDQDVRLEFTHNSVDTTDQVQAEVRWREAGGAWETVSTGSDPFFELPAPGVTGTFEWQARTRGEFPTFGPWSPVWSFTAASRPEVVIQVPAGTVLGASSVALEWGYQNVDPSGQSRWEAELLDGVGGLLEAASGSGGGLGYVFGALLEDSVGYSVRVRGRAGSGLWSEWDETAFVADFPLPFRYDVFVDWDVGSGSASLTWAERDDSVPVPRAALEGVVAALISAPAVWSVGPPVDEGVVWMDEVSGVVREWRLGVLGVEG